jgi:hypothetical protein
MMRGIRMHQIEAVTVHGPYREIPIRVELLRVKDKGFIS